MSQEQLTLKDPMEETDAVRVCEVDTSDAVRVCEVDTSYAAQTELGFDDGGGSDVIF